MEDILIRRERQRLWMKNKREERAKDGVCVACGGVVNNKKICSSCLEGFKRRRLKRKLLGKCATCKDLAIPGKVRCAKCDEKRAETQLKDKQEVLSHYGNICQCCGEHRIEFLTIDHINGDGAEHRRNSPAKGGRSTYLWLRRNDYPSGYQVLCFNCNIAKGSSGECPHQTERRIRGY